MSYVHCPSCGFAYDFARRAGCARCDTNEVATTLEPEVDLETAVRRVARATPAELAALEPSWQGALIALLFAAWEASARRRIPWSTTAANNPARLVMKIDDTGPEPITTQVGPARPQTIALAPRGRRLITRAGAWGMSHARTLLARFR